MIEAEQGNTTVNRLWRWLGRTPVQTFILIPLAVIAFELTLYGRLAVVPWGAPLMVWGYLQYLLVGGYRHPRAVGSAVLGARLEQILTAGRYGCSRPPMYPRHF